MPRLFEGTDFERMSATEIRDILVATVHGELEQCARMADDMAKRMEQVGRPVAATAAYELAAKIRARQSG